MHPTTEKRREAMAAMAETLAGIAETLAVLATENEPPPTALCWCEMAGAKLRTIANEFDRFADSYAVDMARL